jgi:hypothetical protein
MKPRECSHKLPIVLGILNGLLTTDRARHKVLSGGFEAMLQCSIFLTRADSNEEALTTRNQPGSSTYSIRPLHCMQSLYEPRSGVYQYTKKVNDEWKERRILCTPVLASASCAQAFLFLYP